MVKKKTNDTLSPEDLRLADNFLKVCHSKEELRDWILTFLDIDFPCGWIDPESNSSPIDWMYQAYAYIRDGRKKRTPSMVVYSARECYKTLSMSCFEFVVMCHFGVTVSHMAAIKNQSEKAVSYVSTYLRKCRKFIEYLGRNIDSAAKSHIKITETDGDESYLKVIVCTMAGANGDHTLIFCLDGHTEILIKNPDLLSNRKRLRKTAQNVFEMLESGKSIEAMSFNHNNGQYEFQPITRWSRSIENRTQLVFDSDKQVTCTDNHEFFVIGKGYIPISEISVGDRLVQSGRSKSNKIKPNKIYSQIYIRNFDNVDASLEQFMLGSLLGDGCIYKRKQNNGLFACTHSIEQLEYAEWKINFLNLHYPTKRVPAKSGYTGKPSIGIRTGCNSYFNQWTEFRSNLDGVENINPFGLAIWFQDHGSSNNGLKFHTESFSYEQNLRLKTVLKQNFDIDVEVVSTKEKYFHLVGGVSELYKVYSICGKFIRPSMKYKFDRLKQTIKQCAVCGSEFHNFDTAPNNRACYDQICQSVQNGSLSVRIVSAKKILGKDFVYDFTVNEHHNLFANGFLSHNCADELDVVQYPHAFEEAKLIPGPDRGRMPLTIFTSTRKFSFGLMQKEIDMAIKNERPVLHWNIIDVTEKCLPNRHKPNEPKVERYISKSLPLKQISPKQFEELKEEDKSKYDLIEAYAGCAECPLLPVCKTRLASRPDQDIGGLYKSIDHVINTFKSTNPDIAEAQLMCFNDKAEVLMADGSMKSIADIQVGDSVISHTGQSQKVTKTFQRWSDGEAYEFISPAMQGFPSAIVTNEHPMFVNGREWVSIKDVQISKFDKWGGRKQYGDYLSLPISYLPSKNNVLSYIVDIDTTATLVDGRIQGLSTGRSIPNLYDLDKHFGWIVGYYLAEGHISKKDDKPLAVVFGSHVKEKQFHEKVRHFAASIGLTVVDQLQKNGNGYSQTINGHNIAKLFQKIGGELSHNKRLHKKLMNANIDFLGGVLAGCFDGDGTKREEPHREITTTSKILSTQLFTIAARLGLVPRISASKTQTGRKQAYRVRYMNLAYVNTQTRTKFKAENGYNQYRFDAKNPVPYSGLVYNIEVENDHSYIVNGVAVHNCWKPGSVGVIYGRFSDSENIMTLEEAWQNFTGEEAPAGLTLSDLIDQLHRHEIPFYVSGDWGYRHNYALIASAVMPNGEWWIFETFAMSELEFEDQLKYAKIFRDKYKPKRWFMDTAYPGNLKTFTKNGMPCKDFTKDIMYGIEAVRGQIVNSTGRRRMKVIKDSDCSNDILIQGFKMHHFMTDAQGRITQKPDDEEFADVMDALRYGGQNLFPPKKNGEKDDRSDILAAKEQELMVQRYAVQSHLNQSASIYQQIVESTGAVSTPEKGWSKNKRVFFDFSGPE